MRFKVQPARDARRERYVVKECYWQRGMACRASGAARDETRCGKAMLFINLRPRQVRAPRQRMMAAVRCARMARSATRGAVQNALSCALRSARQVQRTAITAAGAACSPLYQDRARRVRGIQNMIRSNAAARMSSREARAPLPARYRHAAVHGVRRSKYKRRVEVRCRRA